MDIKVTQKKFTWNYHYTVTVDNSVTYTVEAKRALFSRRKVKVFDSDSNVVAELYERGIFHNLKKVITTFNWPHYIKIAGVEVGWFGIKYRPWCSYFFDQIESEEYYFHEHTGNSHSVFKGDNQVGLIERNPWRSGGANKYQCQFDFDTNVLLNICFIIYEDLMSRASGGRFSAISYEKTIKIGGKKQNKGWEPKLDI